jgi:hypothetical protein
VFLTRQHSFPSVARESIDNEKKSVCEWGARGPEQNPEYSNTLKRITIGRENTLLLDIGYRCYLRKQLNFVSEIMGEDQHAEFWQYSFNAAYTPI